MLNVIANTIDGGLFATLDKFIIFGYLDKHGLIKPQEIEDFTPSNYVLAVNWLLDKFTNDGVFFE